MPYDINKKQNGKFKCICDYCNIEFFRETKQITKIKRRNSNKIYCSKKCWSLSQITSTIQKCKQCNNEFKRLRCLINKGEGIFCCKSCSATYNNTHKTKGVRVSKLELFLQKELTKLYTNLEFHFNRKDTINSELDIYIPSLKLAFELNGIFHYEPIYGSDKLNKIKNNDNRKFQACLEKHIELCIIDTSSQKYFKICTAEKFLNIIINIIKSRLE